MIAANIARNRFGLGAKPDEPPLDDPAGWLRGQFGNFDATPAAIVAAPSRRAVATELADYLEQTRALRQQDGLRRRASASPIMSQVAMPGDAPEMGPKAPAAPVNGDPVNGGSANDANDPAKQARQFARRQGRDYYAASVGARAAAALDTPAPFVERLVYFWSNHFAVSADKLTVIGLAGLLEFEAIRPHVLGKFSDMLGAVERHPAMLLYLDQAQSIGPNSQVGIRVAARGNRQIGLNENLAREIMELHTLGVRTGYTQADVTEFARAMTGWTVSGIGRGPGARFSGTDGVPGDLVFAAALHEPGARTIMGRQYAHEGERQAQAVLSDLATHPATATHICTKLARHFAGDAPPPALVASMQAAYLGSGGDLPTVYRVLIDSPEA